MNGPLRIEYGEYVEDGEEWKVDETKVQRTRYFCGDVEISEEEYEAEEERRMDRDRYASFALEGLLAARFMTTNQSPYDRRDTRSSVVKEAWALADEMLKQRGY